MEVRRRGGTVVVINPLKEAGMVRFRVPSNVRSMIAGDEIASLYVQPHVGGDLALLTGMAKVLIEDGHADQDWISAYTTGYADFKDSVLATPWDSIIEESGVDAVTIRRLADCYVQSTHSVFSWAMGITHHRNGTANVQAIANLALLRGMIGKPGAGLMPIRGHSNVQGIGSVGVTPRLKQAIFDGIESTLGLKLPTEAGRDTMSCMEGAADGSLKFGLCLGGNLFGSNPDQDFAGKAFNRLEQVVYLSTTLNTGHAHGTGQETLILPVLARDEEPEPTTQESMFNFVRMSDGGPERFEGARSEIDVIATLAEAVMGVENPIAWQDWKHTRTIRKAISEVVPGYAAIADIDGNGGEFQIGGRTLHEPVFALPGGKARFHSHTLDATEPLGNNRFRLMTIRSEGQFNTVVYEEHDLYRGVDGRYVILVNPLDLEAAGLADATHVDVQGPGGRMSRIQVVPFGDIRRGSTAMYFPEANVLLSRAVDDQSRTPAFKGALVTLTRSRPE